MINQETGSWKLEANLFISGDVVSKSSRPTFCFHSGRLFSWEKLVRLSQNVSCIKQVLALFLDSGEVGQF